MSGAATLSTHPPMNIFITDSAEQYSAAASSGKLLLEGSVIRSADFLSDEELLALNTLNNSSEVTAGEQYIAVLESLISGLDLNGIPPIPFQEYKARYEQVYSLLFYRLSQFGKPRFQLEIWINYLKEFYPQRDLYLEFNLDHAYSWFKAATRETERLTITIRPKAHSIIKSATSSARNLLQSPFRILSRQPAIHTGKKKVMLVTYNIAHHIAIFKNYVRHTLANTDYEIHVVVISNEANSTENLSAVIFGESDRIFVHDFARFRTTNFRTSLKSVKQICRQLPELSFLDGDEYFINTCRNYSWMQTAIEQINPAIAMLVNIHETGRMLSDIANVSGIPTVQVDYGLFSDHDLMNSRISFSARAVVSEAVKEVWERRGDTSGERVPIGFCKLDDSTPAGDLLTGKSDFYLQNGLDPELPTVFFASSWSLPGEAYDNEKKAIVKAFSAICVRNDYNLIVKKHPLETDNLLEELVKDRRNQRVFTHSGITLEKAVVYSDIVTTQGSSIVLEALYYGKMPVFIGSGESKQFILAGMTKRDAVVYFNDFGKFEKYVQQQLNDPGERAVSEDLVREKTAHILLKTDGKAFLRLYDLADRLLTKKPSND